LSKGEKNGREVVLAFSSKKMLEDRDVGAILSFWPSVWRCSDILRTGQHLQSLFNGWKRDTIN